MWKSLPPGPSTTSSGSILLPSGTFTGRFLPPHHAVLPSDFFKPPVMCTFFESGRRKHHTFDIEVPLVVIRINVGFNLEVSLQGRAHQPSTRVRKERSMRSPGIFHWSIDQSEGSGACAPGEQSAFLRVRHSFVHIGSLCLLVSPEDQIWNQTRLKPHSESSMNRQ